MPRIKNTAKTKGETSARRTETLEERHRRHDEEDRARRDREMRNDRSRTQEIQRANARLARANRRRTLDHQRSELNNRRGMQVLGIVNSHLRSINRPAYVRTENVRRQEAREARANRRVHLQHQRRFNRMMAARFGPDFGEILYGNREEE